MAQVQKGSPRIERGPKDEEGIPTLLRRRITVECCSKRAKQAYLPLTQPETGTYTRLRYDIT